MDQEGVVTLWGPPTSDQRRFRIGTRAFVYVCSARVATLEVPRGDIVIIHEMLHSLGLGENPPTSDEITKRVVQRCGR